MRNNQKYLMFSIVFLIVVLAIQIVSAAEGPYGWEYEDEGEEEVVVPTGIDLSDPGTYQRYLKIVNALNESEWVSVMIEVYLEEERERVISSLSETEIRDLRRELMETVFTGEITKQGLDKLINNTNIRTMNLGGSSSPATDESTEKTENQTQEQPGEEETKTEKEIKSYTLWIIIGIILILIILYLIFKKKK